MGRRQQNTGWVGFIRVDGKPYTWMGAAPGADLVAQTDFSYTSTRSTFVLDAGGKVEMNVTFLSTVTPNDLKRQSLTFSYLDVGVHSLDGASHDVELYADVSAGQSCQSPLLGFLVAGEELTAVVEWASGDRAATVTWDHNTADGVSYHQFARQDQAKIQEANQQASWGTW